MLYRISAVAAAAALLCSANEAAAAQRTFVSTTGNDANTAANCSLASPCRSFGSALTVTVPNGEIVVLDSGGYGRVTIDRSVSIVAPAGVYAGISVFAATNGIDINTPSIDVVLRGLTINGQGGSIGVSFLAGNSLTIEDCTISNMANNAIDAAAPSADVRVKDTTIRDNSGYGIDARNLLGYLEVEHVRIEGSSAAMAVTEGANATVSRSTFERNNAGVHALANLTRTTTLALYDTVIAGNNGDGLYVFAGDTSTVSVTVSGGTIAREGTTGVRADANSGASAHVALTHVTLTANSSDAVNVVSNTAGTRVSVSDSTITHNTGYAMHQGGAGVLLTRQNNVVHDNNGSTSPASQTLGTLTSLSGV